MPSNRHVMGLEWEYALPPKAIRSTFRCRNEACATFYSDEAERYHTIGAACIITAWKSAAHDDVAGFVTFAPNGLRGQKYSTAVERELGPDYSMEGKSLPCWFIGQLARADSPELRGLGKSLVWLAIMDIVQRASHGAGSCIMIEAEHRPLVDFYVREFGFTPLYPSLQTWKEVGVRGGGKMLLYLTVEKATAILRQAGIPIRD